MYNKDYNYFDIPPEHKRMSSSDKFIKKPTANFK